MAYDAELAERIRGLLRDELDVTEKRMFGGLTFLVNGNMSVTVSGRGGLMVRHDPDDAAAWLDGDVVTPFEMRGKPMNGWLRVGEPGYAADDQLHYWVDRSVEYARNHPHH
jgi:TfoX/Sxy family transcriptional regulator of competence genes